MAASGTPASTAMSTVSFRQDPQSARRVAVIEDERAGWPEISIDLVSEAPARYEYDEVACVVAGGPGGAELPIFVRELELSLRL